MLATDDALLVPAVMDADVKPLAAIAAETRERAPLATAFVRESLMRQDPLGYARSCEALECASRVGGAVGARVVDAPVVDRRRSRGPHDDVSVVAPDRPVTLDVDFLGAGPDA